MIELVMKDETDLVLSARILRNVPDARSACKWINETRSVFFDDGYKRGARTNGIVLPEIGDRACLFEDGGTTLGIQLPKGSNRRVALFGEWVVLEWGGSPLSPVFNCYGAENFERIFRRVR